MYCKQCGKQTDKSAEFCRHCGTANSVRTESPHHNTPKSNESFDLNDYMSKLFKPRLNRLSFLCGVIVIIICLVIAGWVLNTLFGGNSNNIISELFALVVYVALVFYSISLNTRRLHDTGHSGWLQLIGLIPIIGGLGIGIYTLFCPGQKGNNEYGSQPSPGVDIKHIFGITNK